MQNPREILLNCYSSVSNRVMNHPPPISCPIFCLCITFFTAASVSVKHWLITADIIAFRPHMLLRLTHGGRNYFIQIWHQKKLPWLLLPPFFVVAESQTLPKGDIRWDPRRVNLFFWIGVAWWVQWSLVLANCCTKNRILAFWRGLRSNRKSHVSVKLKSTSGQNGGIKIPNFKDDSETEAVDDWLHKTREGMDVLVLFADCLLSATTNWLMSATNTLAESSGSMQ